MKKKLLLVLFFVLSTILTYGQSVAASPEYIKALTPDWKGERFSDGRPKVPDAMLERLRNISVEEAWGFLRNRGYHNQFERDWFILHPDEPMTGRVVTAQYIPLRPDLEKYIRELGKAEGRTQQGGTNSWPIDILVDGDIYIADSYGKIVDGTLIGDNLGNSIFSKTKRGVIFNGSIRDTEGLNEIEGFNAWVRGHDPSYLTQMSLLSINYPVRIGNAVVLPGDVVLAKKYGVVFIPAHLLNDLVLNAEVTALRDEFGHQRLKEGKYKPGQIDSRWTEDIQKDFLNWMSNYQGKLPMTKAELDNYFRERNW